MTDILQAWDEALLLLLNGAPEILAPVAWWLTNPWCSTPVYLFVIWRLFARTGVRIGALRLAAVLITFAGTDAISSRVLKPGGLDWIVVGDRTVIEAGLRDLGWSEIIVLDGDGNRVE